MKRLVCAAIGLVAAMTLATSNAELEQSRQAARPFWNDLKAGPYAVGFRVLYHRDNRRSWLKKAARSDVDSGRPIRLSLWYPAIPTVSALPMKYGDYLHHDGLSDFRAFNDELDKRDTESWVSDLSELSPPGQPMFEKLLSTPVAAYRDAPTAQGHFPLVIFSGGKGSRADANVELGEYLASYGYIVATVPQLGPSDQEIELGSSPEEISLHADDFDSAITVLRDLPEVDFGRVATVGHSAGGEVAVELALRHREVTAVIGLDASYGTSGGSKVLVRLPEYAPGRKVGAALLDLRREDGAQGVKLDLTAIDALRWSDIYRVTFAQAFHGDFTEWGSIGLKLSVPMPSNPDGHTRVMGYQVNQHACRAVRDFLDARLRGRKDALRHLTAAIQEVPGAKYSHVSASYSTLK
jgi:pimeloyl-ACP methyl ester carboxylesterase